MERDAPSAAGNEGRIERDATTGPERAALPVAVYYARREGIDESPETAFGRVLPAARWGILQRLLRGLLREAPDGLPDPIVRPVDRPTAFAHAVAEAVGIAAEPLRRWAANVPQGTVAGLPLPASAAAVCVPVRAIHGFDRYRLAPPAVAVTSTATAPVAGPTTVVDRLEPEGVFPTAGRADAFRDELADGVANLALALLADRRLAAGDTTADPWGVGSTVPLERAAAVRAHPVHPLSKTRLGMAPVESLVYAAEFADRVDLRFAAVRRERLVERAAAGEPHLSAGLCESVDGLADALPEGDYGALPVHPWQYRHALPRLLDGPAGEHVVPLPDVTHPAAPLLNLRTVRLGGEDGAHPHLKLPTDLLKTSHRRTLPPAEVHDGPLLTDCLAAIGESGGLDAVGVLDETAAARYDPADGDPADAAEGLGALIRQDPHAHRHVRPGDAVVPVASLLTPRPGGRPPLLLPVVERFADATGRSTAPAATGFLEAYADVFVPAVLRLVSDFGVGPEAHQQNAFVVLAPDGRPRRGLVRDFGGVRIDAERIRRHGLAPDVHPDSRVDAGREGLYEAYAELFDVHLGELIVGLVQHLGVDEGTCWSLVRDRCTATFDRLRADPGVPDATVDADEARLFAEPATRRARTCMRLVDSQHASIYATASNPLAGGTGRDDR